MRPQTGRGRRRGAYSRRRPRRPGGRVGRHDRVSGLHLPLFVGVALESTSTRSRVENRSGVSVRPRVVVGADSADRPRKSDRLYRDADSPARSNRPTLRIRRRRVQGDVSVVERLSTPATDPARSWTPRRPRRSHSRTVGEPMRQRTKQTRTVADSRDDPGADLRRDRAGYGGPMVRRRGVRAATVAIRPLVVVTGGRMSTRPCPRPHCGRLITNGAKYCARHLAEYEQAKDARRLSAGDRGYSWQWALYSRQWLKRFPYCGQRRDGLFYAAHSLCAEQGIRTRATITDHIRPLRDGGDLLDPDNHQSLCTRCNTRKG